MVYLKIICNILKKKFKQKGRPRSWGLIFFNISNPVSKLYFRKFLARPRSWGFIFFEISNPASTWGGLDYEDYGNFINALNNVLICNHINNSNIIRKDFKSRSLIYLIEKESINKKFQWLDNSVFKQYLKNYINNELKDKEKDENENLIKYIEEDENILNNEDNKNEPVIDNESSSNSMEIDSKNSENNYFNDSFEELIEDINVMNIKEEGNDSLKTENKIFSDKSEIENNEIKIDSGKYDNTSNINNIKRINILENEVDKNNDDMFNSKIFNDNEN